MRGAAWEQGGAAVRSTTQTILFHLWVTGARYRAPAWPAQRAPNGTQRSPLGTSDSSSARRPAGLRAAEWPGVKAARWGRHLVEPVSTWEFEAS